MSFFQDDDKVTVKRKIEGYGMHCRVQFKFVQVRFKFFPKIIGGFYMLNSNKNLKLFHLIGDGPIVDQGKFKYVYTKNIYLCPLKRYIETNEKFNDIEDEQDLHDVFLETCVNCKEVMPMDILEKHSRKCRRKKNNGIGGQS